MKEACSGAFRSDSEVAAGQACERGGALLRLGVGEAGERRHEVDVARHCLAGAAAGIFGMDHDHRHVGLLLVGQRALAAEPAVRAAELAVVGGAHDRGRGPEVKRRDGIEHALQGAIVVADHVQIEVVVVVPHGRGVARDLAQPGRPADVVGKLRARPTGLVQRL